MSKVRKPLENRAQAMYNNNHNEGHQQGVRIKEKIVMKKIISMILALVMLAACTVCFAEGETVLRVGTNPEFAPFEYVGDSGEVEGIDADIIAEVAKDLGMTVQMESMEFDALVPALMANQLDVVIAGMTITEEKKQSVLFSDPYFTATQVVIVTEGSAIATEADLAGKKVGVQLGTTGDLLISDPAYGVAEVARYSKGLDAAMDLKNGRLDAVVIDTLPAKQFVASLGGLVVKDDILTTADTESYGIAVKLEDTELMEKINASLKRMQEDGTFDQIVLKYVEGEDAEGDAAATDAAAEATEAPADATEAPAEG